MTHINIGLLGLGNIGQGVVKILLEKGDEIERRTGVRVNLLRIATLHPKKAREVWTKSVPLTRDASSIIGDREIDVVVELVGGYRPALEYVLASLKNGKHVVTANKALLARHGPSLLKEAERHGVLLNFEASVGGGMPLLKTLRNNLAAEDISEMHAILNGTCNYILTKMTSGRMTYKGALIEARKKGFAEKDPTLDVEGIDTMHKAVILARVCFGAVVKEKDVYTEGITHITPEDIEYANELGFIIKLLAIMKKGVKEVEMRIHPTLVPKTHPLASVNEEYNAIFFVADNIGQTLICGKGAGRLPTASAVISDIIDIAQRRENNDSCLNGTFKNDEIKMASMQESVLQYYLRIPVMDMPGVIAKITSIFGKGGIGIASIIQKERKNEKDAVPVVFMFYETREASMQKALRKIRRLDVVKGEPVLLRVEPGLISRDDTCPGRRKHG